MSELQVMQITDEDRERVANIIKFQELKEKRREMIKKRTRNTLKVTLVLCIVFGICIGVLGHSMYTYLQDRKEAMTYETYVRDDESIIYTSYEIKKGDTLSSISKEMVDLYDIPVPVNVEMKYIIEINKLGNIDKITAGNYLIIPYIIKEEEA